MAKTLEQLVVEIGADIGVLQRELRVAGGAVQRESRSMERDAQRVEKAFRSVTRAANLISGAIAAIGVQRVISGFVQLTRTAIDQAATISDLAEQVGTTAEEYQAFQFAIRDTGGRIAAVQPGLVTFARQMSELRVGTGTLAAFLAKTDPEFSQLLKNTRSSAEAINLFADRIAALSSQEDRLALAQAGFGRGGREFVNALSTGSDGLAAMAERARELGAIIDNETIERADELNDAIDRLSDVIRAQFTSAAIDAEESGRDLVDVLSDPETIRRVGELAGQIGDLANLILRAAAAFGRMAERASNAFTALRSGRDAVGSFGAFDAALEDAKRRSAVVPKFAKDAAGQTILIGETQRELPTTIRLSRAERTRFGIGTAAPEFSPTFTPPPTQQRGTSGGASRTGRDPLAQALETLRFEASVAEQIARERERFEQDVTRAFEQETLTRTQLIELSRDRQIAELERLGFAEQQAADLRVKINATADEQIQKIAAERFEGLVEVGELAFESIADAIAGSLLSDAELSFGELASSFARTVLRMQITAAAANLGEILSDTLKGSVSGASSTGKATTSLGILGTLGKILGFADGGIVKAPVLAAIGENPATRPEVVAPLSELQRLIGGGGVEISVVNAIPAVRATPRRVAGRSGRDAFEIALESGFDALLRRGVFRDELGGRHAPGQS